MSDPLLEPAPLAAPVVQGGQALVLVVAVAPQPLPAQVPHLALVVLEVEVVTLMACTKHCNPT